MKRRQFFTGTAAALLTGGAAARQEPRTPGRRRRRTLLVWSEGTAPAGVYPDDIRGAVAEALKGLPGGYVVKTATLSDPDQGLGEAALAETAALFWWGHLKHRDVTDETVARIVRHVREEGMGFVALHSAHFAKPFQAVVGASGAWKAYVNDGKPHAVTVADRTHPLARGVRPFTIPKEERYEEPFVVPTPEAVVLEAKHESTGTTARQALCWTAGKGRVLYFRPGHEEFPVYFMPEVKRLLRNAALWASGNEAGIWEDADPSGKAARAAGEPPLALILRDLGYAGVDVTAGGEAAFSGRFARAKSAPVTFTPLAAYGTLKTTHGGWYPAGDARRTELWRIDGPKNKQMRPPLMPGGKTTFAPGGDAPFGLWISSESFKGEVIHTEDVLQNAIARFGSKRHKAHVYHAVRSDGTPVPDAVVIGFEYSTNDDNQEIVALVENVRLLP